MQYTNKLITLAMLCSVYTPMSFSCDKCDALKAQYSETISAETNKISEVVDCSCSHPRPTTPKPVAKLEETIDCSCSHPRPVVKPVAKVSEIVDCSCSHPRPTTPKPIAKLEETIDCSCSHPRPTPKPVIKEEVCPYAAVEEIITDLIEKITVLKNKVEKFTNKEDIETIIKDLDNIIDALETISSSDLSPEEAMEKVLEIKRIIDALAV